MGEGEQPISEEEKQAIVRDLDGLMGEIAEEGELLKLEEEALLHSIEWGIRLRSREARVRDPSCVVARFEELLDSGVPPMHWLIDYSVKVFPEEAETEKIRRKSHECAMYLWEGYGKAREEGVPATSKYFREWYVVWRSCEPLSGEVNLVMALASIKRLLFVARKDFDFEVAKQGRDLWYKSSKYEDVLDVYRLVSQYAEEEASGKWDFEPPELPF